MTNLTPEKLLCAAQRLIDEIGELSEHTEALEVQRLEQAARGLCAQLKAIETLESYMLGQAARDKEQKYTNYEDLPPLPPEDRERFKQELIDLLSPKNSGKRKSESASLSKPAKTQH